MPRAQTDTHGQTDVGPPAAHGVVRSSACPPPSCRPDGRASRAGQACRHERGRTRTLLIREPYCVAPAGIIPCDANACKPEV